VFIIEGTNNSALKLNAYGCPFNLPTFGHVPEIKKSDIVEVLTPLGPYQSKCVLK
jgi:hypothetical protein